MNTTYQNRRHEADPKDVFPRNKLQNTDSRDASRKWTSACRRQHYDKCHGISHGSRTGRVILKLSEINLYEYGPSRDGLPTTNHTDGNGQYIGKNNSQRNGKAKNISSNRHEVLLGQRQNPKKPFPHIMGIGK